MVGREYTGKWEVESLGWAGEAKLTAVHYGRSGKVCKSASMAARRLKEST